MSNNEIINFKYRASLLSNIISCFFFIIYLIIIFIIIKCSNTIIAKISIIFLTTAISLIILSIIFKKASVIQGQFEFGKNELNYSSLNKVYIIKYNEIEYISKESFIDYSNIFNIEKYYYRIKIKNAKYFIFSYYDETLISAIEKLSEYSKIKIDDVTK